MSERIATYFILGLSRALTWLPEKPAHWLGRSLGRLVFHFSPRRRVAYADLKAVFGSRLSVRERWQIIRTHYGNLGESAVEFLRLPLLDRPAIEKFITINHPERLDEAARKIRPTIFLTGHFGNWELMQYVPGLRGQPLHVLARDQKPVLLNRLLNRFREYHGAVAIGRGMGMRGLFRVLKTKGAIGMLGDQDAGKHDGLILPLFGRKTSVPTGAFELARRTGACIIPSFMIRRGGPYHEIFFEDPIEISPNADEAETEEAVRRYLGLLEDFVRRWPSELLLESKRLKNSWTIRILILSDGKPGHFKQAEALAMKMQDIRTQYGRPGMEYKVEKLEVRFRSLCHRILFSCLAFFFIPFAQGRVHWFRFFLNDASAKALEDASADFILSAGSSLAGLNLCLARESRAKSIVLMKPGFPFNLFRYDLAVIGRHDTGILPPESFRTFLTPSPMEEDDFEKAAHVLKKDIPPSACVRLAVFLGGPTRRYCWEPETIAVLWKNLEEISPEAGDYLVTTSRRTPEEVVRFLKSQKPLSRGCRMLVVASEDPRPEVVPGMIGLAEILIVTEDSISMISEAVRSGKKVIVLELGPSGLPEKHRRFKEGLVRRSAVLTASVDDLPAKIREARQRDFTPVSEIEDKALVDKLEKIL